jgi:ribosome-associated protein
MVKKPVKKNTAKRTIKGAKKSQGHATKRSPAKAKKTSSKKPLTDKERNIREANAIANSEKKKKPSRSTATKRPKKVSSPLQTTGLLDAVVEGMRERKGKNIMIMNLQGIENRVTDYFVICDAESHTHVNSIADSIEETVEKMTTEKSYHSEGNQNGEWILIDYINVVAHIFLRETREHYNIEGLWGDAEITTISN